MINYTREEAIEKVLAMKAELGRIPTERDYKKDNTVKLEDLEKALGVKGYAAVNIAVLKALRKDEGKTVNFSELKSKSWQDFIINPAKQAQSEAKIAKAPNPAGDTVGNKAYAVRKPKIVAEQNKEVIKMDEENKSGTTEIKADIVETKANTAEIKEMTENKIPTNEQNEQNELKEHKWHKEHKEHNDHKDRNKAKRDYKFWSEEEIARIIKKFYDIKGRLPSDQEIRVGFLRNVCGEPAPTSPTTISKYLGANKTEWLVSVERILSHKTKNGASDGEPIISFEQPLDFLSDKSDNFESDEALEAAILKKKQENMELISEDEYERYQFMDLEQFFKTAEAVRNMVEDGTLKKIQAAANRFDFETRVCTEEAGINLYFIAKIEK